MVLIINLPLHFHFFCFAITHRIITLSTELNETIKTPFDEARLKVNIEKLQL